jgi:ribose 5-phosphate isomerase B
MTATAPLPESEVRALVRRVVEGVLAEGPSGEDGANSLHGHDDGGKTTANDAIAIGSDHGGYRLKEELAVKLGVAGHQVVDCGTDSPEVVDYPEFAHAVARRVSDGSCRWGIIVDGAGIGSAIVANKVPGVRAALCYDLSTARNSREHNHANVLTLGAGLIGAGLAWQIVQEWLSVPWGPDRHARRVAMIDEIERTYLGTPVG